MSQTNTEPQTHEAHATPRAYVQIAVILALITGVEVAVYYMPAMKPVIVPTLLVLSAVKFAMVVLFCMHLKFDNKLFSVFFTAPLILAGVVLLALLSLFGALFTS